MSRAAFCFRRRQVTRARCDRPSTAPVHNHGGSPTQHPSWCDRTECTATGLPGGGLHWSPRAVLDPDPRTDISATVRIGQGTPVPGYPGSGPTLVDLTVHMPALDPTDTDADYLILMEGERAVVLGEMLVAAGRVAGRSGNPVAGPANLAGMERAVRTTAPGDPGDASR